MRFHLLLFLTVIGLAFSAKVAHAQTQTVPGHFTINLNDNCSVDPEDRDCSNPNGSGGWGSDTSFTDQVNTNTSTNGFTATSFTCTDDQQWFWWWWQNNNESDCDTDPSIKISPGGTSTAFGPNFSSDAAGGGILDYFNGGSSTISEILITTTLQAGVTYTCNGDGLFAFCGLEAVDNGQKLEILFAADGDPGIVTATPEPAEEGVIALAAALAAMAVARRWRSRRITA